MSSMKPRPSTTPGKGFSTFALALALYSTALSFALRSSITMLKTRIMNLTSMYLVSWFCFKIFVPLFRINTKIGSRRWPCSVERKSNFAHLFASDSHALKSSSS
ncbi:hypothetical protein V8G54_001183 [Vigna mungo]|uniref:Uncharacterized protein n=1 Tax=Vigna mungo TaxID=3915 RepID=A0AAQ3SBJ9_VIGMU